MARIRETLPDLQQMIIERLHGTRLKIKSGDTMDALNWTELSYPFRVGNQHVRNPSVSDFAEIGFYHLEIFIC